MVQGAVADMMNWTLRQVDERRPDVTLVYQTHDGAKWAFLTKEENPRAWLAPIVEREWDVEGVMIRSTAEWKEWSAPDEEGAT